MPASLLGKRYAHSGSNDRTMNVFTCAPHLMCVLPHGNAKRPGEPKVCQLHRVRCAVDQQVLRLHVPMQYPEASDARVIHRQVT